MNTEPMQFEQLVNAIFHLADNLGDADRNVEDETSKFILSIASIADTAEQDTPLSRVIDIIDTMKYELSQGRQPIEIIVSNFFGSVARELYAIDWIEKDEVIKCAGIQLDICTGNSTHGFRLAAAEAASNLETFLLRAAITEPEASAAAANQYALLIQHHATTNNADPFVPALGDSANTSSRLPREMIAARKVDQLLERWVNAVEGCLNPIDADPARKNECMRLADTSVRIASSIATGYVSILDPDPFKTRHIMFDQTISVVRSSLDHRKQEAGRVAL